MAAIVASAVLIAVSLAASSSSSPDGGAGAEEARLESRAVATLDATGERTGDADGWFRSTTVDGSDLRAGVEIMVDPTERAVAFRSDRATAPPDVSVRVRTDGAWGQWANLELDDEEGPDAIDGTNEGGDATNRSTLTTGLLWFGSGVDRIEVVADGSAPLQAFTIDPGPGPGSDQRSPAAPVVATLAPKPNIKPRSSWTSSGWTASANGCGSGPGLSRNLSALVVHHTVNANTYGADEVDDLLRSIHTLHTKINGWCDIGYNFVIDRFGTIWEARTDSMNEPVIGGHAKGFNTSTMGVALLGQHQPRISPTATRPTAATTSSLLRLASWRLQPYGVDPLGKTWLYNHASTPPLRLAGRTWHYVPTVVGHRDLGLTSCPGDYGLAMVRTLPESLAQSRDTTVPLSFPAWNPSYHGPGFLTVNRAGGLRPAGTASPPSSAPGARSGTEVLAVDGNHDGGHLLYGDGAVVAYGSGIAVSARPAGSRSVVDLVSAGPTGGWVLAADGTVHSYGNAAPVSGPGAGAVRPVSLVIDPASASNPRGYVLGADGTLTAFGGAPALGRAAVTAAAVDAALGWNQDKVWGWVLDDSGHLAGVGGVPDTDSRAEHDPVAVVAAYNEPGGWVVDSTGAVWPFGGARRILPVTTDVAGRSVVDAAQLGVVIPGALLGSGDARYVGGLFRLLVGRDPSAGEVERRVAQLEDGVERADLVAPLLTSDHWSGSVIDDMYQDVLGRSPDQAGRNYWLGRIRGGMTYQSLGIYFYGSTEYANRAGSSRAYVNSLYEDLLGRQADADGLAYWTSILDGGRAWPPDVVHGFYVSRESRRERVARLYRRILNREPSVAERDAGVALLADDDDLVLAADLVSSVEFYRRAVD